MRSSHAVHFAAVSLPLTSLAQGQVQSTPDQMEQLRQMVLDLQRRVSLLEAQNHQLEVAVASTTVAGAATITSTDPALAGSTGPQTVAALLSAAAAPRPYSATTAASASSLPIAQPSLPTPASTTTEASLLPGALPGGATLNYYFDGYYEYNFNAPVEADYVIRREWSNAAAGESSAPAHVDGGTAYAEYQFTPGIALAARSEYLSDRGALFSNRTQALKEVTRTYKSNFADGFDAFIEYRRDWTRIPYFVTSDPAPPANHQDTAAMGLIWWYGAKQGSR